MNITKELITDLGIISMSISENDNNIICYLVKVEKNHFLFKFSGKISLFLIIIVSAPGRYFSAISIDL